MNDHQKEYLLHKVVAASAFLFALCILPVAQYFLVTNQLSGENGEVAGVSTDKNITQASIPSEDCQQKKDTDIADLDRYNNGKKIALLRSYEISVEPYRAAIRVLQGTPETVQSETAALNQLIDTEYQPYLKKLSEVESAVESQKKEIESRSCLAE